MKVFGLKKEEAVYEPRTGVYAVIFHPSLDQVGLIRTDCGKLFLPGGGIEGQETHEQCLEREAREEMGSAISVGAYIGSAKRYFYSTKEHKDSLSIGHFYICKKGEKICEPTEEDHHYEWVPSEDAIGGLFHEHQSWAVREAALKKKTLHNKQ
ncbi:NUDIX domain-containing protein [Bacillus atrophaeus]|uniref:NUDIX hydrolase n=1 Tax=Bacillus atrophaeus TaxID=1452 RepID=UPI001EFA9F78|nr:NUDIX domain-containing protein [Bacillus atrophaeus]MCG8397596.1 NUDIX domain-containing protein [Bacillus atrophaeus]